ncbi:hypothetical protein HanXRQr2_Chr09g0384621 [Helianthus annuus]|uniref:Uncharacterized protein n=2 Tax=Helianthus annuus TaxID=4232 RepID=A0A9K3I5A9_HELAN|nr:uncharacterized protein LOC110878122 [Helianthus annuus]KAF5790558.1 hypothetical protein HanXRQr2_Chr09g0384621 [Helianthus annuus]KAJ0534012.1 hypothetical protein HanIR_Chr09g0414961 [Helianthus annuus]KAJ0707215.1 hypothetical protein HanLR1_Chr09g0316011 [Helianthus annuus]KAJ0711235.1 hypothetical protein HanOQP8_Chr09g0321581 [Helianthus annuus]
MDLDLVKFINSDLTWKAVKKGHRSMVRHPRRTVADKKSHDSVVFDYEKSGVAVLGQHFAEEILDVPIKKRILLLQAPGQGDRSPQPQTPSPHHEPPRSSEHASEKPVLDLNDFSGIELLAAAACHSSGQVESSAVEEHSIPRVESYSDALKQDISPVDSNVSSVQDNTKSCDDGIDESDKSSVPSKVVRLHWDLNTVMDEWEEPCDIHVDPLSKNSYSKDVSNDGLQIETTKSQVTEIVGVQVNSDAGFSGKKHDAESCISKSDVVDSFVNPAACEKVSTSTASVSLEEITIKVGSDDKQAVDKLTSEDHLSDCCGSNVSQDKVKSGYDSPVEDGELREPATHSWEKEESEELECVDYESDNMYEDNFDAIESVTNEVIDEHPETIEASVSVQNNDLEVQGDKADASGPKHSQPVTLVEKDSISKTFIPERKNIPSMDIPMSTSCIRRSRSERDFDQEKLTGREGPSYHRGGQWVDSFSRNKHGSGGYPRPKNIRSDEAINYNPRGVYRNESYGIHSGAPPSRDISRDRSRVGLRRAPQEEYNNPDPYYSERKTQFLASNSSNFNRGANLSRSQKQSRSRSRSGSPIAWHFQKKTKVDTKRQSPDYKPDTRFPFRKPSETEAGLVSQTTGRVIRRFDDRNVIGGQYRERRTSPVRMCHRTYQRHDQPGYVGKLKPDDHFGPRLPPNGNYSGIRDEKYGMMNERRRFRYADEDNGFRYTRTDNKCFRDPKYTSEEKGCRYTTNKMFNTGEGHFRKDN